MYKAVGSPYHNDELLSDAISEHTVPVYREKTRLWHGEPHDWVENTMALTGQGAYFTRPAAFLTESYKRSPDGGQCLALPVRLPSLLSDAISPSIRVIYEPDSAHASIRYLDCSCAGIPGWVNFRLVGVWVTKLTLLSPCLHPSRTTWEHVSEPPKCGMFSVPSPLKSGCSLNPCSH